MGVTRWECLKAAVFAVVVTAIVWLLIFWKAAKMF